MYKNETLINHLSVLLSAIFLTFYPSMLRRLQDMSKGESQLQKVQWCLTDATEEDQDFLEDFKLIMSFFFFCCCCCCF